MVTHEESELGLLRGLSDAFADLGARLSTTDPDRTPETIVRFAADHIPGSRWASLTTLREGQFTTVAATDEQARRADELQYTIGSGPCVDAIVEDATFVVTDIANDPRWPEYGPRVNREFGVASMLSYRLALEVDGVVSALNIYGTATAAFDHEAAQIGLLLATHASLAVRALLSQELAENLQQALQSNRDIGVAMGVLMTQYTVTRQQAFDLLRLASQRSNRKLRDVARDVADTGMIDFPGFSRDNLRTS